MSEQRWTAVGSVDELRGITGAPVPRVADVRDRLHPR